MKIDWEAMVYIILSICIAAGISYENKLDNDLKIKQIEYCREIKIEKCPETK